MLQPPCSFEGFLWPRSSLLWRRVLAPTKEADLLSTKEFKKKLLALTKELEVPCFNFPRRTALVAMVAVTSTCAFCDPSLRDPVSISGDGFACNSQSLPPPPSSGSWYLAHLGSYDARALMSSNPTVASSGRLKNKKAAAATQEVAAEVQEPAAAFDV